MGIVAVLLASFVAAFGVALWNRALVNRYKQQVHAAVDQVSLRPGLRVRVAVDYVRNRRGNKTSNIRLLFFPRDPDDQRPGAQRSDRRGRQRGAHARQSLSTTWCVRRAGGHEAGPAPASGLKGGACPV